MTVVAFVYSVAFVFSPLRLYYLFILLRGVCAMLTGSADEFYIRTNSRYALLALSLPEGLDQFTWNALFAFLRFDCRKRNHSIAWQVNITWFNQMRKWPVLQTENRTNGVLGYPIELLIHIQFYWIVANLLIVDVYQVFQINSSVARLFDCLTD